MADTKLEVVLGRVTTAVFSRSAMQMEPTILVDIGRYQTYKMAAVKLEVLLYIQNSLERGSNGYMFSTLIFAMKFYPTIANIRQLETQHGSRRIGNTFILPFRSLDIR